MKSLPQQIEALIAADQVEAALAEFRKAPQVETEVAQELIQHQAMLAKATKERRRSLIDAAEEGQIRNRVRFALLDLLGEWVSNKQLSVPPSPGVVASLTPKVFISYSRSDLEVAEKIRHALQAEGIQVCIDSQNIQPGEDIEAFIQRVVADSDVVLSLVSGDSLLSPWVGMESVHSLYDEALQGNRKLIACYLDEAFLAVGFRLEATEQIDAKIEKIDALFLRYAEKQMDTSDLNRQKSRLFELRNNLGKILDKLRNILCLDVRTSQWDENIPRLIAAIKATKPNKHSPGP